MHLKINSRLIAILFALTFTRAEAKTIKLLAIGNSFSANALRYFKPIVEASGNQVVIGHAYIGGCDFQRHVTLADAFEKDPTDPKGRPYANGKKSLQDLLKEDTWEYVTIQQVSHKAPKPETFQPYADQLIAYIRKYAPQAEIVVHETWAYRDDHPTGGQKGFVSTDDMYRKVRKSYDSFTQSHGFRLIPSGDAMEAARHDPDWGKYQPDPEFDPKTAIYPNIPKNEKRSLHHSFHWSKDTKTGKYVLHADRFHANPRGEYLLGCVWFEFFYGQSVLGNTFKQKDMTDEEMTIMQRIAHRVVTEKQRPTL